MKRLLLCLIPLLLLLGGCESGGGDGTSGPITLLALGDSITGDVNYPGVPPWPSLLQDMRPEWSVINAGEGSERSSGGRAKIGRLLSRHTPDTVVLLYGSVNAIHNDTASYESDLRSMIASARGAGARVLLCTVPPVTGVRIGLASSIDRINDTVRTVASSEEGVVLIDLFREFGAGSDRFPDGLHPDLDGQRIIAVAVREKA